LRAIAKSWEGGGIESEVSNQDWWSVRQGKRQETKAMDAKWQGKGFTLPLLVIYRSRGATLPGTPRAAPIKCRQRHPPLTGGPYRAETDMHTCVRDHHGVTTEGPRRPVTSTPTSPLRPRSAT
jgi:hypothetical protein